MNNRLDRSQTLIRVLKIVSTWLAKQRGLPIVVGVIFIIGGGTLEFLNVAFESPAVSMVEIIFRTFGLATALVGILMLEPLGQS
jgi:hypothetical protein